MPKNLDGFFCPKSVAIVGASRTPQKLGAIVLKNIQESGFKGKIYPINPNAQEINGLKCYENVSDIEETPELVIILVPVEIANKEVQEAGEKGVKNVIVITAGYKETGEEGAKLEAELKDISKKYEMNILGPNCLGFVNNLCPINGTFAQVVNTRGNLRFLSQSGALAAGIFDWCTSTGLGYDDFITLGNKVDVNENDVLEYFLEKSKTREFKDEELSNVYPIGMYLESISDGTRFLELSKEITKRDPILILKPGKTEASQKAMQSHTGSIAGEDAVLTAVLKQAGVVRCDSLEDFFDYTRAFAWENIPQGPNVYIISNAGGPAVISADAVIENGMQLPQLPKETQQKLFEVLPRAATILNPVDVLGDSLADRYIRATEIVLETNQVDSLIAILTPQIMTEVEKTAEMLADLSKKYKRPIFASFIGGSMIAEGEKILNQHKIPSFRYPERAISAAAKMWQFRQLQEETQKVSISNAAEITTDKETIKGVIDGAQKDNQKILDNLQSDHIIRSVGIRTPPTKIVSTVDEAKQFLKENVGPVVLKMSSPGLLHKKDRGGIILDIMKEEELDSAWDKMQKKIEEEFDEETRKHVQVQIQKEIINGVEVIVGFKRDPTFGPVLLFGAGGSLAELILDRNLYLLPIDVNEARKLVQKSKIYTILKGHRGGPQYELEKLYDLIVRIAELAVLIPDADSIEINPVIVTLNDVWGVDAKVVLKSGQEKFKLTGPQFKVGKCVNHTVLASTYHFFDIEPEKPFNFIPGQYISVKVAENTLRAYSVATHEGSNKFSLLIDIKPGGPGSKFFENLQVGDKVTFLGPFGVFTYKSEDGSNTKLFLGTGSGVSPLRCMIEAALEKHDFKGNIKLYVGLNLVEDLFWIDYYEQIKKKYPNFDYQIALFKPDDTWKGHKGFVTELVKNDYPDAKDVSVYLCGNKYMIEDCIKLLTENGCPKERIYTEKFV